MQYKVIKNADKIINNSPYLIKNPEMYQKKWHEVFKNNNPICLELGMGRGDFIIDMAYSNPNINYIGLEIVDSQMVMAVNRLINKNLPNLRLINMDAKNIGNVFQREIDTIYLTFCDPWPKKQDEKRRFTHEGYLRVYDKVFKKEKHIILKTDNKGFFAYSIESLSNYWYIFSTVSLDLHKDERNIKNIMTNYEKQYQKEGRPIYYLDAKSDG